MANDKNLSLEEQLPSLATEDVDWGRVAMIASSDSYKRLQEAWTAVVNLPKIMTLYQQLPRGDAISERLSAALEDMDRSSARNEQWRAVANKVCELIMVKAMSRPLKVGETRLSAVTSAQERTVVIMAGGDCSTTEPKPDFPLFIQLWIKSVVETTSRAAQAGSAA